MSKEKDVDPKYFPMLQEPLNSNKNVTTENQTTENQTTENQTLGELQISNPFKQTNQEQSNQDQSYTTPIHWNASVFQKPTDNEKQIILTPEQLKQIEEENKKRKEAEEKEAAEKKKKLDELEQNMICNSGDREISYVTRGAIMRCSKGSHRRRLDILVDHGFEFEENMQYEHPYPLMTEDDWILETNDWANANIKKFGICHSTLSKPNTNVIHLVSEEGPAIEGPECDLQIVHCWYKTQKDASLCDKPLLTEESFLFCKHCGMITFESNGSDYEGEQDLPTFKNTDDK